MNHDIGSGQVQACPAGHQTDQKDGNLLMILKRMHFLHPVLRGTVQIPVGNLPFFQGLAQDREHTDKLAEHEDAVSAVHDLVQQFQKHREFSALDLFRRVIGQ